MSRENVEAFERGVDAINRRDIEALTEVLDPEVEWHDVFNLMLGGEATTYRGHEGVRELFRDMDGAFAETHSARRLRDPGPWRPDPRNRPTLSARGSESGAEIESPIATISQFKNGKATRVQTYLYPKEALEAGGLTE